MKTGSSYLKGIICFIFMIYLVLFVPAVHAETEAEYIAAGETQLLEKTPAGILGAFTTFQTAQTAYPNNSVINTYLALTRLAKLFVTENPDGAKALMESYGFSLEGDTIETLDVVPQKSGNGDILLPETAPSGEAVRLFFADSLVTTLNASIINLDTAVSNWTNTSKHIIAKEKLGTDADIEFDYGSLLLLRAWFKAMKCSVLIISAYDLNVDVREAIALSNAGLFKINDMLSRYGDLLKLLPTTTTPVINGAAMLTQSKNALISMIDDYLAASDHMRNHNTTAPGAEESFEIDEWDLLFEEYIRNIMEDAKTSLNNGTALQIIEDSETWVFTDVASSNQVQVIFENNKSEGYYNGDFIGWYGEIEGVKIVNNQISIKFSSWNEDLSFTGTLNPGGNAITGGTYSGYVDGSPVSGTFTGARTALTQETTNINLNPLFGNGIGPYNLRDLLPKYNDYDEEIYGTAGHGLGNDPTWGGMLPGMTQDEWGFEGAAMCENIDKIDIPVATITLDGNMSDWAGVPIVATDMSGDGSMSYSGSDIKDLYLAKDNTYLYAAITTYNGAPNTDLYYTIGFSNEHGLNDSTNEINVFYYDYEGIWYVNWYLGNGTWYNCDNCTNIGANFIELKVPLDALGNLSGRFVSYFSSEDSNTPCIQIKPTNISGTLSIPGYNGHGAVYIAAYLYDGYNDTDEEKLISYQVIYPGEFTAGMAYSLTGIPIGEEVFVSTWWDADYNGVMTTGDYSIVVPSFTTITTGNIFVISDQDGDGILDSIENTTCTATNDADSDDDGIPDGVEDYNKNGVIDSGETNPCDADSDDDSIPDGLEDANKNGLLGPGETDPLDSDTDDDTMPDGWEVDNGLNPLVNDANIDTDGDGFKNLVEYTKDTDPSDPDSHPPRSMPWLPLLLGE